MDQHGSPHQSVSSTFLMDASLAPLKRRFERLNDALHERLPFSTAKTAHSLSTVFEGSVYHPWGPRRVLAEFEANGDQSGYRHFRFGSGRSGIREIPIPCSVWQTVFQKLVMTALENAS